MRGELTGRRPSRLSTVFRRHAAPDGRLADWTRHVDGDWFWYCPHCNALVILQEEKGEEAAEKVWSVTRRAATGHKDRPWGWLVETHADGTFTVTAARANEGHQAVPPQRLDEDQLIAWIERAYVVHWDETGHPQSLLPARLRAAA